MIKPKKKGIKPPKPKMQMGGKNKKY